MTLADLRVGIYARHSTEKQNPRSSEDQIERCSEWVAGQGGTVAPTLVFRDDALTGQTTRRPGLQAMLRAAEAGKLDVLVVEDLSRVSRDASDAHGLRKRLRFAEVRLVAVADGLDTGLSSSSLLFGVQAAMGEEYIRQLADKTRRGMRGRARAGKLTGAPPYGYQSAPAPDGEGRVAVIDEERAPLVRRIFAERARGDSYGAITDRLNREAVPPPRGRRSDSRKRVNGWAISGVRAMLRNPRYAGSWTFGAHRWVRDPSTGKRVKRPGKNPITVELAHLAIIDAETWAAVQAVNNRTARKWQSAGGRGRARNVYVLSGLLRCGVCHGAMVINCGRNPQYRCDGSRGRGGLCGNRLSVRETDVRGAVLDKLDGYFARPEVVAAMLEIATEELRAAQSQAVDDVAPLRKALHATERQIGRLVDLVADGSAPASVLDRIRELEATADEQRGRLDQARTVERLRPRLGSPDEIVAAVRRIADLAAADSRSANEALRLLLTEERITMTPLDDGSYRASWAIDAGALLMPSQSKTPSAGARRASGARDLPNAIGCGGPHRTALGASFKADTIVQKRAG